MEIGNGAVELDLHGMTCVQAQAAIDAALRRTRASTYRVVLIHGYHGGTHLRDMVRRVYAKHPRVKRVELGLDPGSTVLVLREY